ncbi:DUF3800 domain-containing protein [Paracoccus sulfuroxidans]|uniref:Uncharacterized protein DUF3800 n=1 Tax=Paracoccus sulfuroxidans TaxID=384678 RepID=A0A562NKM5_9RHOB|nr:uncharacterized protein DUF3800 [Paracoccus sulfuroxidans]
MTGYIAFVDESGCEGDPQKIGGFEFLSLVAVVVRRRNLQCLTEIWDRHARIERKPSAWRWRGFKDTNSDASKYLASELLAGQPFQFSAVIVHKPSLHRLDHKAQHGDLYFYATQLLLERISWIVRDGQRLSAEDDPRVRIVFSERKNTAYDKLIGYSSSVKRGCGPRLSNTEWSHIDLAEIKQIPHHICGPLDAADFIAGSIASAIEMNRKYGLLDDRYLLPLAGRCYKPSGGSALNNGLKLYPADASSALLSEDRFRWVRSHYMKK